jgi:hypothetical protein
MTKAFVSTYLTFFPTLELLFYIYEQTKFLLVDNYYCYCNYVYLL